MANTQGGYPHGSYPMYSQEGQGYPQQGYPQHGYPQPGYPQPGYPQPGYPQQGYSGYPQSDFQATNFQDPSGYVPPADGGEDGEATAFSFDDQSIRKAFIRKVYSILMCQLLITMGFIALFTFHDGTIRWVNQNDWLFWLALAILLVTLIGMACCTNVRRQVPLNFIFLFLFTLAQSFLLGITASRFDSMEVMMAVGITAGVCLGLTIFALQTKWDFTTMGGFLVCVLMVFLLFGLITIFIPTNQIVRLVFACIGVLIFSMYLVYDTQLMMGGKHKYSISPEEYIFAALNLYLDIINIFLYLLTIIGILND